MTSRRANVAALGLTLLAWLSCIAAKGSPLHRKRGLPERRVASRSLGDSQAKIPRYELNMFLGITAMRGAALLIGGEFGILAASTRAIYIGPEINFSLYPSGSILGVLAGVWDNIPISHTGKSRFSLGVACGPGFSARIPSIGTTTSMAFLEIGLAQEIQADTDLRAQIRPGIIGGDATAILSVSLSFDFR